ncbi:uncharacterized protein LOC62_05G007015 [Vanrija pseudolonga]|uniref:DUF6534 domain-containing protein n=1 Tax=Vanrija pseudolonga TaxID=143232 RepID=A0AAF0YEL9_9TREE|nr:hypothetical protein LOC62_05G007015 [Vanrija pseudolonga]
MIPLLVLHVRSTATAITNETVAAATYAPVKTMNFALLWGGMLLNIWLTFVFPMHCTPLTPSGIFTFQFIKYWSSYNQDKRWIKGVVLFVGGMAYGNFIYLMYFAWWTLVAQYGMYLRLLRYTFLSIFVLIDSITVTVIQGFFTYRTWRLNNRNWYLAALLIALIGMSVASGIAQTVTFISLDVHHTREAVLAPIVTWNVGSMCADLIITLSILWGLWKTRTGWHHSDKVIGRLVRMTLEAQTPPLIIAILFTTTFIILFPRGLAAYINNSKLNCIGLMYSLNSRQEFGQQQNITMENTPGGREWAISQVKTGHGAQTTLGDANNDSAPGYPDNEKTTAAGTTATPTATTTTHDSESTSEELLPTQSVAYGLRGAQVAGARTEGV